MNTVFLQRNHQLSYTFPADRKKRFRNRQAFFIHLITAVLNTFRAKTGTANRIFAKLPILRKREAESLTALLGIYAAGILSYLKKNHVLNSSADFRNLRIMDYINEHVGDAFGLPDLASELGLSVPHTSCVVKRLFGKSFSALLQERRVEKAKYFLNGTELSLHEIAELCGFSSEFHLSRVFKQLNGIPPGQYRGKREI